MGQTAFRIEQLTLTAWARTTSRTLKYGSPMALIALRALLGPAIRFGCTSRWPGWLLGACALTACLTDIFDGVIARRLGVATDRLRMADSIVDGEYYLFVAWGIWLADQSVLQPYTPALLALFAVQTASYVFSWLRLRRIGGLHAYSAKVWGLSLCAASIWLLAFRSPGIWLTLMIFCGFLSNLDGILIIWLLPERRIDVHGAWHALALRRADRR
ncbi:MAG: CDP-alcohol phosphatidyltransferase family protein [Armatimonadetes bacterium]|nr:CDP-alcohol phosphatidyltransferase family protein [Armatimonadota bacterium]MDE2206473.1 CDP-alcohol phosphatidyltransferase family protein [Armatimonadota bacterium]